MQNSASLPADRFDSVLSRLPACIDLDALAIQTKAIERRRVIENGANLLRLSLARGPGGLSLSQTAAWATMLGFAPMSDPGVKYRLDKSVEFLEAILTQQLAAISPGAAIRWAGRTLRASDGTCIRERGSKTTDWRVHAVYDLGRGGFSHLELTDRHGAEAITRGAPLAGEIRIGDRYFARAASLLQFRQQSQNQADFIVRTGWNALNLTQPGGKTFDLIAYLQALPDDSQVHEINLLARTGKRTPALPLRLIVQRKPPEAIAATHQTLLREAARKQKKLDPRSLVGAAFMILVTSLPAEQIERAFKRLKSLLNIDAIPTRTDRASRSWLYSHLILALLCDDLSQEFLDFFP